MSLITLAPIPAKQIRPKEVCQHYPPCYRMKSRSAILLFPKACIEAGLIDLRCTMTILDIRLFPDPILREVALEVRNFDEELKKLVMDMAETMYAASGIGLAAPQIGLAKRVVVVDISDSRDQLLVFINPTIALKSGKISSEEGCLSIPEYRETVKRSAQITVEYQDLSGIFHRLEADDLLAICLQHEIDHLDGILFVDHLSRLKREFFRKWLAKQDWLERE